MDFLADSWTKAVLAGQYIWTVRCYILHNFIMTVFLGVYDAVLMFSAVTSGLIVTQNYTFSFLLKKSLFAPEVLGVPEWMWPKGPYRIFG